MGQQLFIVFEANSEIFSKLKLTTGSEWLRESEILLPNALAQK